MATEYGEALSCPINLTPGAIVGGRYRLLSPHGGRLQLSFWEALDMASGRRAALTLVDPDGALPEEFVHEILARTVRLKGIDVPGIAPVLEVFHTGSFGVVVCEWVHGGNLREIADTRPSPAGVASAMQSVAAATEVAHRAGLVLAIDDPSRLRIAADGHAVLAFPATMPEASIQSDLHGIGQAMQVLIGSRGESPFLISTVMTGLLDGGIASAATLVTLLRQATFDAGSEPACSVMPPLDPPPPGFYAAFRNFGAEERAAAARRQVMRAGLVTTVAIVLVALVALGSTLNRVFGDKHDAAALDADKLGLNTVSTQPKPAPPTIRKEAAAGDRVQPVAAGVFSPDGSPDSPGDAGLAIDNNPGTAWSTDRYYDSDPFPKFKPGVGLLLQLPAPTALSAVTVDLNSTGTVVHVRGVGDKAPKTFADTTELSAPTPMQRGRNRIAVNNSAPVSGVLVWISTLGSADGKSQVAISEIELQAATPPA
jgi:putative peptidoglycan lipid II flippase